MLQATMLTAALDWMRGTDSERKVAKQETPQSRRRRLRLVARSRGAAPAAERGQDAPTGRKAA
jgi:hypothetical protein